MGCPIHGHPAMACEHCEAVYARACTNAQAAGYAEAVADVVAHVNASHPSWKRLDDSASGPRVNFVLGLLVADLNAGAHVGAAKKGGAP